MKYSVDWLKEQVLSEGNPDYLFFWGHLPGQAAFTDKSCFSQWFHAPFTVNGVLYSTAEHWMMAKKAELFNDTGILKEILATEKPAVAKELGRKVKNFDIGKWTEIAYAVVLEGNKQKFMQHGALKTFLQRTGRKVLVEASPSDVVWGIGLSQNDPHALNPFKWHGTNLLGFALMEVRDLLNNK